MTARIALVFVAALGCDGDGAADVAADLALDLVALDSEVVVVIDTAVPLDEVDVIEEDDVIDTIDMVDTIDTSPPEVADDTTTPLEVVEEVAEDTDATPDAIDDPHPIDRFPYVVAGDTSLSPDRSLDRYTCAPATDESGPEIVYRFEVSEAGAFVAEVAESPGVDVDLHLLAADPTGAPPDAVACLARANTRLSASIDPGRYWLVVDTYVASSGPKPGAYRLAVEHIVSDRWQEVPLAPGIVWKQKVYSSYAGGRQTVNVLDVDLAEPSVSVTPYNAAGRCSRPSAVAPAQGAIAAINAGFFDTGPGTCPPLDLIKIDGALVSTNHLNGAPQRAFGLDPAGAPLFDWVPAHSDWPPAWHAISGYPSLVTDGAVAVDPDRDTSFFDSRHPRTALGLTAAGRLLLVTVDGRGPAGAGMTIADLARYMVDLGAAHAFNLDGGGSTAMFVAGQSLTGLVNFPSDGDGVTHTGDRAVSDLLLIFSEP